MDPLIVLFGLGVGILVGLTGIGGGSLMTPLLLLAGGYSPVVAIGTDLEASILTASVLVDLGVEHIVAKAISESHGRILERIGAHRVVFPERDMGIRVARSLAGRDVIDYMELDPGFVLLETKAPRELVGKTLADAKVRSRYGLTVVSIKSPGQQATYATPETVPQDGDILVVAGETRKVEAFVQLRES